MMYSPTTGNVYACSEEPPEDAVQLTMEMVLQMLGAQQWKTHLTFDGTTPAEPFRVIVIDRQEIGSAFMLGSSFEVARVGGSGHREALTGRITTDEAPSGEFNVAVTGVAMVRTGSGNAFGVNGYSMVLPSADPTTEAAGGELNTDVRRDVARKVGLQIIDAATSTGKGTVHDAGLLIAAQPGGIGYSVGVKFGIPGGFGIREGGTLIYAQSTDVSPRSGVDFSAVPYFGVAPILLRPNSQGVKFGADGAGGEMVSETDTGAGDIVFGNGVTAIRYGGLLTFQSTPEDTYVTVRTEEGLHLQRRLIAGMPHSGGTGYRTLKVEN